MHHYLMLLAGNTSVMLREFCVQSSWLFQLCMCMFSLSGCDQTCQTSDKSDQNQTKLKFTKIIPNHVIITEPLDRGTDLRHTFACVTRMFSILGCSISGGFKTVAVCCSRNLSLFSFTRQTAWPLALVSEVTTFNLYKKPLGHLW